jgi:dihydroorotate dehydrogenase (NAD+) catalytic subunit
MFKQDLAFSSPYMNAAGTLGFAPDARRPVPWDQLGAFVTNPISMRARKPAKDPALIAYPGGYLLHTGLPNPGLRASIKNYSRRWADSRIPVIVHLMADHPEETGRMLRSLEELENIAAVELSFAPHSAEDVILSTVEMCWGELPLIISLGTGQVRPLGSSVIEKGAAAISVASPRGMLPLENGQQVTGRLTGAGLFPGALLCVRDAARAGIPVIGAGGIASREKADTMLSAGAMAVQLDASLWKGELSAWAPGS